MSEAYIIDAIRTPVGRRNGALAGVRAMDKNLFIGRKATP